MKRVGLLKVAPRVQGKIVESPSGRRTLIVEQKGRDIWRGRSKSVNEAIFNNEAGIGVDQVLLQRAKQHEVTHVLIVIEEQRKIFLAPIDHFFCTVRTSTRSNWQGAATKVCGYQYFMSKYLGPSLAKKRKATKVG